MGAGRSIYVVHLYNVDFIAWKKTSGVILCNDTIFLSQTRLQTFTWLFKHRSTKQKDILILGARSFHCKEKKKHLDSSLDWSTRLFNVYVLRKTQEKKQNKKKKDASSSRGSPLSLRRPFRFFFFPFLLVKQLEIRLTVFVGHSDKDMKTTKKKKSRTWYLLLWCQYCSYRCWSHKQHVKKKKTRKKKKDLDALFDSRASAGRGQRRAFLTRSRRLGHNLRDTGVIAWKWPRVLPRVTCWKCYGNITPPAISA